MQERDVIVVGGGAAGYFAALRLAELAPGRRIAVLEAAARPLGKVRISGGGRCNLTHAVFELPPLLENYPRGHKQLRGVFQRFDPARTMEWFQARGVELKVEGDGRVFPVSDSSQSIIDCLSAEASRLGVEVVLGEKVRDLTLSAGGFELPARSGLWRSPRVVLATGSSPATYPWLERLGHRLIPPVPSLFTFTISDPRLAGLSGVSAGRARLTLDLEGRPVQQGPVLITHWGLSGPAVLKLSAWGARLLAAREYRAGVWIDWVPDTPQEELRLALLSCKRDRPRRPLEPIGGLPRRLWQALLGPEASAEAGSLPDKTLNRWAEQLKRSRFEIEARGVFKEEFVTAGGVDLSEIDLKTMQSRRCPGLYVTGELLDVDGLTGGVNFQNAWASGWIAGESAAAALTP